VDVISKAEFDSQREQDPEADNDLVFGPLDQEEVAPPINSSKSEQPMRTASEKEVGHRGRGRDREKKERALSQGSPLPHTQQRRRKEKSEKRARFYPLPNKQGTHSKVSV